MCVLVMSEQSLGANTNLPCIRDLHRIYFQLFPSPPTTTLFPSQQTMNERKGEKAVFSYFFFVFVWKGKKTADLNEIIIKSCLLLLLLILQLFSNHHLNGGHHCLTPPQPPVGVLHHLGYLFNRHLLEPELTSLAILCLGAF